MLNLKDANLSSLGWDVGVDKRRRGCWPVFWVPLAPDVLPLLGVNHSRHNVPDTDKLHDSKVDLLL